MYDDVRHRQVTSVKLSPSARYILLGAGVRARYSEARGDAVAGGGEGQQQGDNGPTAAHPDGGRVGMASSQPPVTSIYRASDLQPVVGVLCFLLDFSLPCGIYSRRSTLKHAIDCNAR